MLGSRRFVFVSVVVRRKNYLNAFFAAIDRSGRYALAIFFAVTNSFSTLSIGNNRSRYFLNISFAELNLRNFFIIPFLVSALMNTNMRNNFYILFTVLNILFSVTSKRWGTLNIVSGGCGGRRRRRRRRRRSVFNIFFGGRKSIFNILFCRIRCIFNICLGISRFSAGQYRSDANGILRKCRRRR